MTNDKHCTQCKQFDPNKKTRIFKDDLCSSCYKSRSRVDALIRKSRVSVGTVSLTKKLQRENSERGCYRF